MSTRSVADESRFDELSAHVQETFAAALAGNARLFRTDAPDLFAAYLDGLPTERQEHNCHCCRRFLERFGTLVVIDEEGRTRSAFWNEEGAPLFYKDAVAALRKLVEGSSVVDVFLSREPVWGTPVAGNYRHLAVTPPPFCVHKGLVLTAEQAMAERREDWVNVRRALTEFTAPMLMEACRVLDSDALDRPEKVSGPARWLRDLQDVYSKAKGSARDHVLWRAIASAPPGYAHPRSSMIGTLLVDIAAGLPFAEVSRRFAAKMHPLQYQRPQAAPSAGNIERAEKIVEKLGIAPSLERRFATVAEATALWRPAAKPDAPAGGVFGHLKAKAPARPALELPPTTMTWEKFARTALPTAEEVEVYVEAGRQNFMALLTATHDDAPPILQWDSPERRNPFSYYLYTEKSLPSQWSMPSNAYVKATAIVLDPSRWGLPGASFSHRANLVVFTLTGCRETRTGQGNALFPETLKSELHEIRSTIEAYSKTAAIGMPPEGSEWACGLGYFGGSAWDARLRVLAGGTWQSYCLDRWD